MKIFFRTKQLQKICSNSREMQRKLGKRCSQKLRRRMSELNAADVLSDISYLPPSRLHELTGREKGQCSVDLQHPYRLLFIPADDPVPNKKDGGFDLDLISSVEIVAITDTH